MGSKYFTIEELVDEETYNLLEDEAYKLFNPKLLETIDVVREILDVPLICNNWCWGGSRDQCGYRTSQCSIGAPKSYHKRGEAVDLVSSQMTAEKMREKLEKYQELLPHPVRIEKWDDNGEISWLHIDLGDTKGEKIYFFRA